MNVSLLLCWNVVVQLFELATLLLSGHICHINSFVSSLVPCLWNHVSL